MTQLITPKEMPDLSCVIFAVLLTIHQGNLKIQAGNCCKKKKKKKLGTSPEYTNCCIRGLVLPFDPPLPPPPPPQPSHEKCSPWCVLPKAN